MDPTSWVIQLLKLLLAATVSIISWHGIIMPNKVELQFAATHMIFSDSSKILSYFSLSQFFLWIMCRIRFLVNEGINVILLYMILVESTMNFVVFSRGEIWNVLIFWNFLVFVCVIEANLIRVSWQYYYFSKIAH